MTMIKRITSQEAADILGVDDSHVRRLCIQGKLKAKNVGGRVWLISEKSVLEYKAGNSYRPRNKED